MNRKDMKDILAKNDCDMKDIVPDNSDGVYIAMYVSCNPIESSDGNPCGIVRMTIPRTIESFVQELRKVFGEIVDGYATIDFEDEDEINPENKPLYLNEIASKLFAVAEQVSDMYFI